MNRPPISIIPTKSPSRLCQSLHHTSWRSVLKLDRLYFSSPDFSINNSPISIFPFSKKILANFVIFRATLLSPSPPSHSTFSNNRRERSRVISLYLYINAPSLISRPSLRQTHSISTGFSSLCFTLLLVQVNGENYRRERSSKIVKMVVKVVVAATPCMQWSQPSVPPSPTSNFVSISRAPFLGTTSQKLPRSRSVEFLPNSKPRVSHSTIRRACSIASFDKFSDDDFSREISELAFRLQNSDAAAESSGSDDASTESRWPENQPEPLDFSASIEMRANRVDLPVSLRMIKLKQKQLKEEFVEAGESAYCSVQKAFSSMVFIIRELHSFTLKMRELLFFEDLEGILERVKSEIHASFVWLFQQVFSHTPTLMMYVMILLANFTVHSISTSSAIAAVSAAPPPATVEEREIRPSRNFESSTIANSCSTSSSSSSSKATSVGGGNGGGGKLRPAASGTDGDGWINRTGNLHRPILPESVSPLTASEEKEEAELWNSVVEEASRMLREEGIDEALLDHETVMNFVSPVTAKVDGDDVMEDYSRTEQLYQTALVQDPDNVLLLANYAQFLYLVARDYDRAEEYFKRATDVEPKDAEAHSKYAHFLWQVRNDLWGAEQTFLEAISADPSNSFYAANYAHFLWSTGGEDTCFPLEDESVDD